MRKVLKDPFGGIKGVSKINSPSPLKIDKEESLKELKRSIELWNKNKKTKKSLLEKLKIKKEANLEDTALHWNYSNHSKEYVDIHLVWSGAKIRTLSNVPAQQVRTALSRLKEFYKKISTIKPDLNNPDILLCYNQTAKKYKFPQKKIKFKDQIEVSLLDPFAGIKGENLNLKFNDFYKDKFLAEEEIQFSVDFFDQIDKINDEKKPKFLKKKPLNFSYSYKTSDDYFDIYFFWAGKVIESIKKVPKRKTRTALTSIKNFIKSINTEKPDITDSRIKLMYEATKEKHRPGKGKNSRKEILPVENGGYSYWSKKTHRWVIGRFDKKKNVFIPPIKNI